MLQDGDLSGHQSGSGILCARTIHFYPNFHEPQAVHFQQIEHRMSKGEVPILW